MLMRSVHEQGAVPSLCSSVYGDKKDEAHNCNQTHYTSVEVGLELAVGQL